MKRIIDTIQATKEINQEELMFILESDRKEDIDYLHRIAAQTTQSIYGRKIFIRGLIEVSNYCKNNCYYCGIRRSNQQVERYRLSKEQILDCCKEGYKLGFRTFVLQGGEDLHYSDDQICDIIFQIKKEYPECAVTLSIGEKTKESYQRYYDAGADRYLLRHETADDIHYSRLHPKELSLPDRKQCLWNLKEIGYQVGCGFMVGSPGQSLETIYKDLSFIKELQPHMVGIGPFIPQKDTPFAQEAAGTLEQTIRLLSIIRLIHPHVLLPATTALGTIHPTGREQGILSGANVIMPNLSPADVRKKYLLYDNKICTGVESVEGLQLLKKQMAAIGYEIAVDRGDYR